MNDSTKPCCHPAMVECGCYARGLEKGREIAASIGERMDRVFQEALSAAREAERESILEIVSGLRDACSANTTAETGARVALESVTRMIRARG